MEVLITAERFAFLKYALLSLPDGIALLNRSAIIEFINEEGQEIFKRKNHRFPSVGDNYLQFVAISRQEQTLHFIHQAFAGQTQTCTVMYMQKDKPCWFELSFYPIQDQEEEINYICLRAKNITDRIQLEQQLESQRQLQRLKIIKATIAAQEKERREIGRELHDNINQVLTTVKLYNEMVTGRTAVDQAHLQKSVSILNDTITQIRHISKQLVCDNTGTLSLQEQLEDLTASINLLNYVQIQYRFYQMETLTLDPELKTALYRIIQEQVANILKHAKASQIKITVSYDNQMIELKITDNGIGFDPTHTRKGIGLMNMQYRTEAYNGTMNIETCPGMGCSLTFQFPYQLE